MSRAAAVGGRPRRRRRSADTDLAPPSGIVAIVGRPNVGKSTLFNRFTGQRHAIVDELAGLTSDRLYGVTEWRGRRFTVVDTAGLDSTTVRDDPGMAVLTAGSQQQARLAIAEADVCVQLVDVRAGVTALDEDVATVLRSGGKPVILVGNKADSPTNPHYSHELYRLGLGDPVLISALVGTDTGDLLDLIVDALPPPSDDGTEESTDELRLAIIGKPNVGKSSLLNALVGQERALVSPLAGTTRDAVDTLVHHGDRTVRLVDTAGIRRRGVVDTDVEHYSLLRALRALERCDVALLVVEAGDIVAQDRHVAGYAVDAGKGLVVIANKWDLVDQETRADAGFLKSIHEAFDFVPGVPVLTVSATRGPQRAAGAGHRGHRRRGAGGADPDRRAQHTAARRVPGAPAATRQGQAAEAAVRHPGEHAGADDRALRQRPGPHALRVRPLPREPHPRGVRLCRDADAHRRAGASRTGALMRVAVVGAGSWGTALAQSLCTAGCEVRLWARDRGVAEALRSNRRHPWALPGIELDAQVVIDDMLESTLAQATVVILAVPSQGMREIAVAAAPWVGDAIVVSAAKGFEVETGLTMTAVLGEVLPAAGNRIAALSGPNIAIEVARGLPAATVVATLDAGAAATVRDGCNGGPLRFYSSDDVLGVEYAGALKNVVAIAAGVCDGIGAGDNGKAAVITRGLAEIARLGVRAGARGLTFAGLAGLGDCVVTCASPHSRNRGLGEAIGRGTPPGDAIAGSQMVVEGVNATRAALLLAARHGVDMPITHEIHDILFAGKSVSDALNDLMTRGAGDELRGFDSGSGG